VQIIDQMCEGLSEAHRHGIVHRDIKPSNVFLEANAGGQPSVKLLDFGVAKLLGDPLITQSGAVVGTPAYMAPEQARGAAHVDQRADVYSVGAVLLRMLTGHPPKDRASEAPQALQEQLQQLPPILQPLVAKALAPRPADRFATIEDFRTELKDCRLDEGSQAEHEHATTPWNGRDTLVLPEGLLPVVAGEMRRPRHTRTMLLGLSALTVVACTVAAVAALGPFAPNDMPWAPFALGVISAALVGLAVHRFVRGGLRHPHRARTLNRRMATAIVTGSATFGLLVVSALGQAALTGGELSPTGTLLRLLFSVGAAWVALVLTRSRRVKKAHPKRQATVPNRA
jgi:serine/threonine-protein kinase